MTSKTIIAIAAATTLLVSTPALAHKSGNHHHRHHDGNHHHRHKHSDAGIAIGVGAVALIAIAASAKSHENRPQYGHQYGYDTKHNAIARCLHKVQRRTARQGGYGVTLKKVRRAKLRHGDWMISLRVKQRWNDGSKSIIYPFCRIDGRRITEFRMR